MKHLTLSQLTAAKIVIPAISYSRVSSEKQLRGLGLKRQREGNLEWAAKHPEMHIRIDDEKTDEARSAWKADHTKEGGALGSILRQVEAGVLRPPLMLIVEHLDRLSRENIWKAQEQLAGLVNRGILVATTRDNKIYSPESGIGDLILSVVYMSAANEESEKKSGRVKATKRQHVLDAMETKHVLHQMTPGWIRVSEAISGTNRATRKYELLTDHAATVLLIYQMGLLHGAGYICGWLIAHKVPAMGRTGAWNIRHVKRILSSRAPLGHLESRHGLIKDIYPPVPGLTEDLWLRVQAAIKVRQETTQGGYKVGTYNNLLAGIGHCAACGSQMRINTRGDRRYFECSRRAILHDCRNSGRVRVDRVEAAMFEHLDFLEISAAQVGPVVDLTALADEHAKLTARQKRLEAKLQELDDDEMADLVIGQLRELRRKVQDAGTTLNAAQQQTAVATAPVKLTRSADRCEIAAGLKARLATVLFDTERGATLISRAGIVLLVPAKEPAMLLFKGPQGLALVRDGKLVIDPPGFDGLLDKVPTLDARTIAEIQARLRTVH